MALDSNTLKGDINANLISNGFNIPIMPNHTVYQQVSADSPNGPAKGTAIIGADNKPVILKQYDEPALSLMMGAISKETVDHIHENFTVAEISDVSFTLPKQYAEALEFAKKQLESEYWIGRGK